LRCRGTSKDQVKSEKWDRSGAIFLHKIEVRSEPKDQHVSEEECARVIPVTKHGLPATGHQKAGRRSEGRTWGTPYFRKPGDLIAEPFFNFGAQLLSVQNPACYIRRLNEIEIDPDSPVVGGDIQARCTIPRNSPRHLSAAGQLELYGIVRGYCEQHGHEEAG